MIYPDAIDETVTPTDSPEFDPVYDDCLWWTAVDEKPIEELLKESN